MGEQRGGVQGAGAGAGTFFLMIFFLVGPVGPVGPAGLAGAVFGNFPAFTSSMKASMDTTFSLRSPKCVFRALNSLKRSSKASDKGWILSRHGGRETSHVSDPEVFRIQARCSEDNGTNDFKTIKTGTTSEAFCFSSTIHKKTFYFRAGSGYPGDYRWKTSVLPIILPSFVYSYPEQRVAPWLRMWIYD